MLGLVEKCLNIPGRERHKKIGKIVLTLLNPVYEGKTANSLNSGPNSVNSSEHCLKGKRDK